MTDVNAHDQDVTTSLRLNERAQTFALVPMMILMFGGVITMIASTVIKETSEAQINLTLPIVALSIVVLIAAIPAVKAFRVARSFDKEHKQAFTDGQNILRQTSFKNRSVFNNESELVKRIYEK